MKKIEEMLKIKTHTKKENYTFGKENYLEVNLI